jgi:uncharacterized membrane protein
MVVASHVHRCYYEFVRVSHQSTVGMVPSVGHHTRHCTEVPSLHSVCFDLVLVVLVLVLVVLVLLVLLVLVLVLVLLSILVCVYTYCVDINFDAHMNPILLGVGAILKLAF